MIHYTLTRSKRKTLVLYIREGGVDVRAPLRMPKRDIDGFVDAKAAWIADKLARSREREACREAFARLHGASVPSRIEGYIAAAKEHLPLRAAHFAELMGVKPAAVKVSGARTRWGSCSAKRSLCFSWRLMMADAEAVDYVVVHELAHLTEMNHSARFWAIVGSILPDYRERQKRLRLLQGRLAGEDWG